METTTESDAEPVIRARASADLKAAVQEHAERWGLTESEVVRAAVVDYLGRRNGVMPIQPDQTVYVGPARVGGTTGRP